MKKIVQDKLAEYVGILAIVVLVATAAGVVRVVLGWFGHGEKQAEALARAVGGYVGKGLLGICLVVGAVVTWRELVAKLKGARSKPPPYPVPPGKTPEQLDGGGSKDKTKRG